MQEGSHALKNVKLLSPIQSGRMFQSFDIYLQGKLSKNVCFALYRNEWVAVKFSCHQLEQQYQPQPQSIKVLKQLKKNKKSRVIHHHTLYMTSNRQNNYLLMQLGQLGSLESFLMPYEQQLPPKLFIKIIRDICLAYKELYDAKIVHKKLKLKNFLVFKNVLKICNFDNSEIFEDEEQHHSEYKQGDMIPLKIILEEHLLPLCPEAIIDDVNDVINVAEFRGEVLFECLLQHQFFPENQLNFDYAVQAIRKPQIIQHTVNRFEFDSHISSYNIDQSFLYSNHALLFILTKILLFFEAQKGYEKPMYYISAIKVLMKATVGQIKKMYGFYESEIPVPVEGQQIQNAINFDNQPDYLTKIQQDIAIVTPYISQVNSVEQTLAITQLKIKSQNHLYANNEKFLKIFNFSKHIDAIFNDLKKLTFTNYHISDDKEEQSIKESIACVITVNFGQNALKTPVEQAKQLLSIKVP